MIDACVRANRMTLAWSFLDEMQTEGLSPDNFTYSTLIKGIRGEESLQELDRAFHLL